MTAVLAPSSLSSVNRRAHLKLWDSSVDSHLHRSSTLPPSNKETVLSPTRQKVLLRHPSLRAAETKLKPEEDRVLLPARYRGLIKTAKANEKESVKNRSRERADPKTSAIEQDVNLTEKHQRTVIKEQHRLGMLKEEDAAGSKAADSLSERVRDVSLAIRWIKQEIALMKKQDRALIRQYMNIRTTISQIKEQQVMFGATERSISMDAMSLPCSPAQTPTNDEIPSCASYISLPGTSDFHNNRAASIVLSPNGLRGYTDIPDMWARSPEHPDSDDCVDLLGYGQDRRVSFC